MRNDLKYWRDLSKQEKQAIMDEHNVKVVTFEWIEKIYKLKNK